jgi:signal transduction histidine kinase/ActR/RegA family two-component response regulator
MTVPIALRYDVESSMWRRSARVLAPYSIAPVAVLAAITLRYALGIWIGRDAPLMVFVLAMVSASIVGGLGPGLVTTVVCTALMVVELEPSGIFEIVGPVDYVRVVLFLLIGTVSAALGERRLRVERLANIEAARVRDALERERAARADAERSARLRDEFLATVSHELRTPLNAIVGWADLLSGQSAPSDTTAKGLEIIRRNARVQAQLIEDLLDTSRLVEGKLQLDVHEVGVYDVVRDAIETVRHAANAKRIDLHVELDPAVVCGDARRLHQVIWNLLSNAVKFGHSGGHVRVRVRREGGDAVVSVRDDGRGIDRAFLPHVFEKFRQEDASITREYGGLGLGLAISQRIVELHGGTITAQSEGLGAGATFTVRIPLASEQAQRAARDGRAVTDRASRLHGASVLVADDDADSLEIAAVVLERAGARVIRARSGEEALAGIASRPIAAVVLDLMMPGRDGFDVIRALRAQGRGMPVIALTALAFPADRARTSRAGFAAHVTKPIDSSTLIDAVAGSMSEAGPSASAPGP